MSSRQLNDSPWPLQTPHSSASGPSKSKRAPTPRYPRSALYNRQIVDQSAIDAAKALCENTDNAVLSCWPVSSTSMNQNEFTQFVWNSRQPSFAQFNEVDIALLRADNGMTVATYMKTPNPPNRAGALPVQADDPWWGSSGESFNGTSVPFPFYFVIVQSGQPLSNGLPQATFTATQTTFANSVLAAMSSSSVASASSAALLSSSLASASPSGSGSFGSGTTPASSPHGTGGVGSGLQDSSGSSSFPHWAIAVITTLGFLALVAFIALIFLLIRYQRRRKEKFQSRRGSIGSQSPMMANVQTNDAYLSSPPLGASLPTSAGAASVLAGNQVGRAPSTLSRDAASTHSDTPFTGADAAYMAEAFRQALRKPEFHEPVLEGESPDASQEPPTQDEALLSHHLAEEGKDIRSVSSSRGVKVETLNEADDASTARDGHS